MRGGGDKGELLNKSLPCLPPLSCLSFLFPMPNAPCPSGVLSGESHLFTLSRGTRNGLNPSFPLTELFCPMPNAQYPYLGVLSGEGAGDAIGLGVGEAVAAFLIPSLY